MDGATRLMDVTPYDIANSTNKSLDSRHDSETRGDIAILGYRPSDVAEATSKKPRGHEVATHIAFTQAELALQRMLSCVPRDAVSVTIPARRDPYQDPNVSRQGKKFMGVDLAPYLRASGWSVPAGKFYLRRWETHGSSEVTVHSGVNRAEWVNNPTAHKERDTVIVGALEPFARVEGEMVAPAARFHDREDVAEPLVDAVVLRLRYEMQNTAVLAETRPGPLVGSFQVVREARSILASADLRTVADYTFSTRAMLRLDGSHA